jgi:hypothetical protein
MREEFIMQKLVATLAGLTLLVSTIITGVPRTTRAADAENVAAAMEQVIQQALVNKSPEHVSLDTVLLSLKRKRNERC